MRSFTTTGVCNPDKHYMVDLRSRMEQIKVMVDAGQYFTINRARQYGKTTTLAALGRYLKNSYAVIDLDFQDIGDAGFSDEYEFSKAFATLFSDAFFEQHEKEDDSLAARLRNLAEYAEDESRRMTLQQLFRKLKEICTVSEKPLVLMIDEVDTATNNQVFLDFLSQLRSLYLKRMKGKRSDTFQSVILAGVTDVKNLKRRLRPEDAHKFNSPWNIAADFNIEMSLSSDGIAGMLSEYEEDHRTGMDFALIAQEIYKNTSGYPYLVSRICQIMDTQLVGEERFTDLSAVWTLEGVSEAVRKILAERNTLFDSLMGKVQGNVELRETLQKILFGGEAISFNPYNIEVSDAEMYGFIRNVEGNVAVSNRMFETLLYNYFLTTTEVPYYQWNCKL